MIRSINKNCYKSFQCLDHFEICIVAPAIFSSKVILYHNSLELSISITSAITCSTGS